MNIQLNYNTILEAKSTNSGDITGIIPAHNGVKQGSLLVSLLFSLYMNHVEEAFANPNFHPSFLNHYLIPILLYDAILSFQKLAYVDGACDRDCF